MNVVGVSGHYHDSAACLVQDGLPVAAAQEEIFSRVKHDASFPVRALQYCLSAGNLRWKDVDVACYYEMPHVKQARVNASLRAVGRRAGPVPRVRITRRRLRAMFPRARPSARLVAVEHHLSHAASAFYPSPFEEAAVLTVDGVGELTASAIGHGTGDRLDLRERISFPHSLGLFYAAFTAYCGFRVNSGEYKLMGLAAYGRPIYADLLAEVIRVALDGSYRLNMRYFSFVDPDCERMFTPHLVELLGRPPRAPDAEPDQFHADVAASVQQVFEDAVLGAARRAGAITGSRRLVMAGGAALNCVANTAVRRSGLFDDVWVQPAAGDAGGALGAALHLAVGARGRDASRDVMRGALLGPEFDDEHVRLYLESILADFRSLPEHELVAEVARLLADGEVVGWFRGRAEFGPRALGNRSILADPRRPDMKERLNAAVKYREAFRPFAPAVLDDAAGRYFTDGRCSPYMLFVADVVAGADLPAVTHVDGTARVQTVNAAINPVFARLLAEFGRLTGVPVLVNTSFNLRGEPMVGTPEDAVRCFLFSGMDHLAIGNHLLGRSQTSITVAPAPGPGVD